MEAGDCGNHAGPVQTLRTIAVYRSGGRSAHGSDSHPSRFSIGTDPPYRLLEKTGSARRESCDPESEVRPTSGWRSIGRARCRRGPVVSKTGTSCACDWLHRSRGDHQSFVGWMRSDSERGEGASVFSASLYGTLPAHGPMSVNSQLGTSTCERLLCRLKRLPHKLSRLRISPTTCAGSI